MIREALAKLVERQDLTPAETEGVMGEIMHGEATPSQIGAFLTALRMKGETAEEIAGCARAMRAHALRVDTGRDDLVDTCGTGGDGVHTFNISTLTALVAAAAGVYVAKHGNRSVSSSCGSADLMEALGVKIDLAPELIARCINEVGIGFLFAPHLHPAMKYATPPRREMGIRTIFNILGPLANPAFASTQLLGVYNPSLATTMAQVLSLLGTKRALVVHSQPGLDELSQIGTNHITELNHKQIKTYTLTASSLGIKPASLKDLQGGTVADNVAIAREILDGQPGPKRDVVLLNAAAVLYVAGKAPDIASALSIAAQAIDSGRAKSKLEQLVRFSQSL